MIFLECPAGKEKPGRSGKRTGQKDQDIEFYNYGSGRLQTNFTGFSSRYASRFGRDGASNSACPGRGCTGRAGDAAAIASNAAHRSLPEWEESPSAFAARIAVEHSTTNPNATTCTLLPEVCRLLSIPRSLNRQPTRQRRKPDFDWNNDDSVVLHHQPAVAAYINHAGGLTIRQERSWDQDEDIIIAIAPENVGEFIDKLTDVIGIPSFGK